MYMRGDVGYNWGEEGGEEGTKKARPLRLIFEKTSLFCLANALTAAAPIATCSRLHILERRSCQYPYGRYIRGSKGVPPCRISNTKRPVCPLPAPTVPIICPRLTAAPSLTRS